MSEAARAEINPKEKPSVAGYLRLWAKTYQERMGPGEKERFYSADRTHLMEVDEIVDGLDSLLTMVGELEGGRPYTSPKHGVEERSFPVPTSGDMEIPVTHTETICYLEPQTGSGRLQTTFKKEILLRAREMVVIEDDRTYEDLVEAEISRILTQYQESKRGVSPEVVADYKGRVIEDLTTLMNAPLQEYELTYNLVRWDSQSEGIEARKTAGIRIVFYPRGRIKVFGVAYPGGKPASLDKPLAEYKGGTKESGEILPVLDQLTEKSQEIVIRGSQKVRRQRF